MTQQGVFIDGSPKADREHVVNDNGGKAVAGDWQPDEPEVPFRVVRHRVQPDEDAQAPSRLPAMPARGGAELHGVR